MLVDAHPQCNHVSRPWPRARKGRRRVFDRSNLADRETAVLAFRPMRSLLTVLLLCSVPLFSEEQEAPAPASNGGLSIVYVFENPSFMLSPVELRIDESGNADLRFTRKDVAQPVHRPVRLELDVYRSICSLVETARILESSDEYQSKRHFANLGTYTVTAERNGTSRTVRFDNSENETIMDLVKLLRGITTREVHAFDLETAALYAPLAIPGLLDRVEADLKFDRIVAPAGLVPVLRRISDDPSLPLIARNRAEKLERKLKSGGKN